MLLLDIIEYIIMQHFHCNQFKYHFNYIFRRSKKAKEKSQGLRKKSQDPKVRWKKPRSWEKSQGEVTLLSSGGREWAATKGSPPTAKLINRIIIIIVL